MVAFRRGGGGLTKATVLVAPINRHKLAVTPNSKRDIKRRSHSSRMPSRTVPEPSRSWFCTIPIRLLFQSVLIGITRDSFWNASGMHRDGMGVRGQFGNETRLFLTVKNNRDSVTELSVLNCIVIHREGVGMHSGSIGTHRKLIGEWNLA